MPEAAHILVVDDDDRIRDLLKRFLSREGYRVTAASDAESARRLMGTMAFDMAILDVMMPGEDGLSLLSGIRDGVSRETPVLLLTARGEASDRIEGLKRGADDYLAKPFEPEELSLRCAAILRRSHKEAPPEEVEMSGLVFNSARGELKSGDDRVRLTDAELQLLTALAARAGEPVSREELAQITSAGMERSVDVQVTRLRRKIEPNPKEPIHIQTVRGIGYRLMPD
jgi:two-component system phosphate regulon response regulator OmpR